LCNSASEMPAANRLTFIALAWMSCLLASAACRSSRTPAETPLPITRPATHEEELTLIRADSEMFAAVVSAQLAGGDDNDDYPRHLDRLLYDARPYGTRTGYPEVFSGVQGIDPTLSFARAGKSAMEDLVDKRKQILKKRGVRFGNPIGYTQCAGVRVPQPPPPRGRAARAKSVDVHAGCPRKLEYYVTVGLPIHGQPEGLRNMRDTQGRRGSVRGDVWTALVDEHSAGPDGWSWSRYAWLFRRRGDELELAATILIQVIE